MDEEKLVTLKISGQGLSYTAEVPVAVAVQVMALCVAGANTPQVALPSTASHAAVGVGSRESAAEYLVRFEAKRNPDKILALACYLADANQKTSVSQAELKLLFREAGELPPANFTRDFGDVMASGWMALEPQKPGYYWVTKTGRSVLEKSFANAEVKRLSKKTGGGKKAAVSES